MGAPVSKNDDSSTSEDLPGTFYELPTKEKSAPVLATKIGNDKQLKTLKPEIKVNETVHSLTGTDADDFDDKECEDVYQKLKTNRNEDLHISNTRFNRHDVKALRNTTLTQSDPTFTSTVAERPKRINSANFSHHTILNDHENASLKTANIRTAGLIEDGYTGNVELDSSDYNVAETDNKTFRQGLDELMNTTNTFRQRDDINHVEGDNDKTDCAKNEQFKHLSAPVLEGQSLLKVPSVTRGIQSPTPKPYDTGDLSGDDDGLDPLEGLNIPRERLRSFGATSLYSMNGISDDLYQQYMAEIKKCIRSHGFFEAFPSPSVVSEAQKIYRNLDMPSPVGEDGNVLPHPPKLTKKDYLTTQSISLEDVVQKVTNIPETKTEETLDIVHYLCEGLDDDQSKLTMFSAWIVLQHIQTARKTPDRSSTPEDWCKQLQKMCKYARIKTKLVNGIIRGPKFVPGNDLNRGQWIAVLINYTWLLIDPAISHVIPGDLEQKLQDSGKFDKLLFDYVEAMFHDPEEFIFSHYPDEEHWQLLARPVTNEEFSELAVLKSGFFRFRMMIINSPKSCVISKSPETLLSLAFHKEQKLQFKCQLRINDNSMALARLRTCVFLETNFKDHRVNIRVRFPKKGSFILEIFGSSDDSSWRSLISYNLVYEGDAFLGAFPSNPRDEWGPGLESAKMGLTPMLYHSGEILMQKGVIQVAFHDKEGLQFDYALFRNEVNVNSDSMKVSFLRDMNNDVIFVIDIDPKMTGTFILQLLARKDKKSDLKNFCNYFIRKEKIIVVPKLEFTDKSTEEKAPIRATEDGTLEFTVDTTGFLQLDVELKLHGEQDLNLSDHARHWIGDNTGHVDLNFPRKGKYTVRVFGRTVNEDRFLKIKEETVLVDIPSKKWSSFPKQGNSWNSWYKIETPLSHHLQEKRDVAFKVNVKHALDVAVLAANGWHHLDRINNSWQWAGQVLTGPKSTKCTLLARFDAGSDKWSDLVWFKVMSGDDFRVMGESQNSSREHAVTERQEIGN